MGPVGALTILESEANKRGDLFGRLMTHLFYGLGYDERVRLNVHKSGREIDVEAFHRSEQRRVVAECKATAEPIGGDEINKFVGALDAEKRKYPTLHTEGYFIALSGFKESALEQEKDAGGTRVILFDGQRIIEELIRSRIVVPPSRALEAAGRCAMTNAVPALPESSCDLFAHSMGWVWAVYYQLGRVRTHVALVHADGEPLAPEAAKALLSSKGAAHLRSLGYLAPPDNPSTSDAQLSEAANKYLAYLGNECGDIQLEGLPADQEAGSKKLVLEKLFIPLHLVPLPSAEDEFQNAPSAVVHGFTVVGSDNDDVNPPMEDDNFELEDEIFDVEADGDDDDRVPVGEVLSACSRIAILSVPGGGKSTLLKRLAVAYAFPERRSAIDDKLPKRPWLPLFIRCRQLGSSAKASISQILRDIPEKAEMDHLAEAFAHLVTGALRQGNALLLIDGLDEISDEQSRVAFVRQLRTFLAQYPGVSLVITSRPAGFRLIGESLSSYCESYRLAEFNSDDIRRLCVAWHTEVVGDKPEVRADSAKLAETIIDNSRVRQLARNPLLLTTLLLVKRWVGQLPTRRSVLYGKAIEVLLMTWNVEGYEPLDQEEAIPQLAFVAHHMMEKGVQQISAQKLYDVLKTARKQMPEVLAYARHSVQEFIERVELRSSLLMMSGHELEDGVLAPVYDFRHLTFQEYLTAAAIVNGYYAQARKSETPLAALKRHVEDARWKEVIPLAAVLLGRNAHGLVSHLVTKCKDSTVRKSNAPSLLTQCLLDEVQIPPDLLREALEQVCRRDALGSTSIDLYEGKYGETFSEVVGHTFSMSTTDLMNVGRALGNIVLTQCGWPSNERRSVQKTVADLAELLQDANEWKRMGAALATMLLAYNFAERELAACIQPVNDLVVPLIFAESPQSQLSGLWALSWISQRNAGFVPTSTSLSRITDLWMSSPHEEVRYVAAWALSSMQILNRQSTLIETTVSGLLDRLKELATKRVSGLHRQFDPSAALVVAYYLAAPWDDDQLCALIPPVQRRVPRLGNALSTILTLLEDNAPHQVASTPQ